MGTLGLGPWYVVLLFNENDHHSKGSKRKSDIVLHTYPHLLAGTRNNYNVYDNWVTMQIIGPFLNVKIAASFQKLWMKRVRGKGGKLDRGFALLKKYYKIYNLRMWCQTKKKTPYKKKQKRPCIPNYETNDIETVFLMRKRRKKK